MLCWEISHCLSYYDWVVPRIQVHLWPLGYTKCWMILILSTNQGSWMYLDSRYDPGVIRCILPRYLYISFWCGIDSTYTATIYFSYTILANPELEPHAPNAYQSKLVPDGLINDNKCEGSTSRLWITIVILVAGRFSRHFLGVNSLLPNCIRVFCPVQLFHR